MKLQKPSNQYCDNKACPIGGFINDADSFLRLETIKIIVLGLLAFGFATAGGLIFGKIMCKATGGKVNPLIGSAGVSAVSPWRPVSKKVGADADSSNFLLMHAMGPNVAGVIGSAVAAGIFVSLFGDIRGVDTHAALAPVIGNPEPGIQAIATLLMQ
ncbi:MAG: hypothetical protein Ct9H300mP23_03800 [Nitrospinota bacterium]|nr:MAG: hypothetical protein Ct9H300mP23_03800 [Nitrospinota bacterium]